MGYESGKGSTHASEHLRLGLTPQQANPQYISVNWEASGGGAFAVIPINEKGRLPEQLPLFRGHTAVVLDTDWYKPPVTHCFANAQIAPRSPFNDSLIASGSDDGKV